MRILQVAHHLKRHGQLHYARDMYKKIGDFDAVVKIYVEAKEWQEAFELVENSPGNIQSVFEIYIHPES